MVQPHRGLLGDAGASLQSMLDFDRCRLTSKPPVAASAIYPAVYPFPAGWVAGVLALDVPDPHGGRLTVSPVGSDPPWQPVAVPGLALLVDPARTNESLARASDPSNHARSDKVKINRDQSQQSQVICVKIETRGDAGYYNRNSNRRKFCTSAVACRRASGL